MGSEHVSSGYGGPGMRTSAADRERATDVLKAAYSEGRLPKDEFDERCAQVMAAKTYGELTPLISDLPGGHAFGAGHHGYGPGYAQPSVYPRTAYYPPVPTRPASGLAIASLVCGVLEFFLGVTAIPAVILGHMARAEIRHTGKSGNGMAVAGLVLGYIGIAIFVLIIVALVAVGAAHTGTATGGSAPVVGSR